MDKLDLILLKLDGIEYEVKNLGARMDKLELRADKLEIQIQQTREELHLFQGQTQKSFKELRVMDSAILDEVERVHLIFDRKYEELRQRTG